MTDLTAAARQARAALAEATTATLLVEGIGRCLAGDPAVLLHERYGRPQFICLPGTHLGTAARRSASARLHLSASTIETITFAGTLSVIGVEQIDDAQVDVVGLLLHAVVVERDDPRQPAITAHHEIPLHIYFGAEAEALGEYAARVAAHTNAAHPLELRRFVARTQGLAEPSVAAARVRALDCDGALVEWVDDHGGHTMRLDFPARAGNSTELAQSLLGRLSA